MDKFLRLFGLSAIFLFGSVQGSDDATEVGPDGSLVHHTSILSVGGDGLRGRRKIAEKATKAPSPRSSKAPTTTKSSKSTKAPSAAPSMAPTACTYDEADVDEVIEILSEISDTCLMLKDGTPQNLAYQWVLNEDTFLELGTSSNAQWLERYALAILYYSTEGLGDSWLQTTKQIYWDHIETLLQDQVSWFNLYNLGLTGTIPSELRALTKLTTLQMDNNAFTGTVPSELAALDILEYLSIDENALTGTIPSEFGSFSKLTYLFVYDNDLTGTLPSELAQLSLLKVFSFFSNHFTGTIPTEYGTFSSLTGLWVYVNDLTGTIPTELGNISTLKYLWVNNNTLTGTIPTEIGNLSKLLYFNVYANDLSGTIPTELAKLTKLSVLNLVDNPKLESPVPDELCAVFSQFKEFTTDWCDSYATCCP